MNRNKRQHAIGIIAVATALAALTATAQQPAFESRKTSLCGKDHHFTEKDLLWLSSDTYSQAAGILSPEGNGIGYYAWKMISHPNVGQGINLGYSLPSELGGSLPWEKLPGGLGSKDPWADFLGNSLNAFGAVVILGQLADDFYNDNPMMQVNFGKSTAYWTIGISDLFSKSMKISSIAVQVFDYTLNELGNAAVQGNKRLWYDAYKNYFDTEYGHKPGQMQKWDRLIEEHHGDLGAALKQMHQKFWQDDFRESFKKQKYIWSNSEPSDAVKEEVRVAYLQETLPFLLNYYRVQQQQARTRAVNRINSIYNELVSKMSRDIVFSGIVTTKSGKPLSGVSVSLFNTSPVATAADGRFRTTFRMCELLPELFQTDGKIEAAVYYTASPGQPPVVKQISRPIGTGFLRDKNEINDVQDRLDFMIPTDNWVKLTLQPQNVDLEGLAEADLTVTCLQDDGQTMDVTDKVQWHSDQTSVATVAQGRVTAKNNAGMATITAFIEKSGQRMTSNPCRVSVKMRREVDRLAIQPSQIEIMSGGTAPIEAIAHYNDGTTATVTIDPECSWTVDPPNLKISPQGTLQAGTAVFGAPDHKLTVQYTYRGKTVTATVPVRLLHKEKATQLKINKPEVVMGLNQNVGLGVTALVGAGTSTYPADVTSQVTWTVSDDSVITQTAGGVIVSGSKEGYCSVTAHYRQPNGPALQAVCKVTVVDMNRPLPVPGFSIEPPEDPHPVGEPVTFRSNLSPAKFPLTIRWFLDGQEIAEQTDITHRFDAPGSYPVRLFIEDPLTGNSDAVVKTVHVERGGSDGTVGIEFSPDNETYDPGSTVRFVPAVENIDGITEYRWYLAGEYIGSGEQGIEHAFAEEGQYAIKLGLRFGSNFDELSTTRTLSVSGAGISTLGTWRNKFKDSGAPRDLVIKSTYWRGGTADWSDPVTFNGSRIGAVRHYIFYTGVQADGGNVGYLVYVPEKEDAIRFKVFRFSWSDANNRLAKPQGYVHYAGTLPLHGKEPVWDSVRFTRQASRLCEVEWRCTDGSSCRARISMYKSGGPDPSVRYDGMDDLGCEAGAYPPIVEEPEAIEDETDSDTGEVVEDSEEPDVPEEVVAPDNPANVSGLWLAEDKHYIHVYMDGDRYKAVPLENEGPVGWKEGRAGQVVDKKFSLLIGVRAHYAAISEDGTTLDWGGSNYWKLVNPSPTTEEIDKLAFHSMDLTGLWLSKDGHYVQLLKEEQFWKAIALENEGPIGWKEGKAGKLNFRDFSMVFGTRAYGAKVSKDGKKLDWGGGNYWTLVNPSPTAKEIDEHSFHPLDLTGKWISSDGHHIRLTREGDFLIATALENKGPVGWKTGKAGRLNFWDFSMVFGNRAYGAKVSRDGNQIDWGGGNTWNRMSPVENKGKPGSGPDGPFIPYDAPKKTTEELRKGMKKR